MKEVYNFTRGNQVAVHPYLKKKKTCMGHVSTRIRIYFVKSRIFLHNSPTRNPHLFESAFQSDLRLRPHESGKE